MRAGRCATCFGNKTVSTENTSKQADPALRQVGLNNLDFLTKLRDSGYQSYGGQRVADLSGDENNAGGMIRSLAGSQNPYTSNLESVYGRVANTGPQNVSTTRVIDNVPGQGAGGSTADYMNPYLAQVLAPQLREIDQQAVENQKGLDARAAMGGAFGDARSGFEASQNTKNANLLRSDTTGRGYSDAFNNAMGLKTADINRLLNAGQFNASMNEQGLARALQGGQALQGLDKYNTGRQADLANLLQQFGATGRGIDQAKLDAAYQEFAKKQQYPLDIAKLIAGGVAGAPGNTTGTTEKQAPDNSGWGLLGALGGTALGGGLFGKPFGGNKAGYYGGSPENNANLWW